MTARKARDSEWMSGSAKAGTTRREAYVRTVGFWQVRMARSSVARVRRVLFPLDKDLHGRRQPSPGDYFMIARHSGGTSVWLLAHANGAWLRGLWGVEASMRIQIFGKLKWPTV